MGSPTRELALKQMEQDRAAWAGNPASTIPPERASVRVLRECIDLQLAKSKDYQSDASNIKQAEHYLRGVDTIVDTCHGKMLRIRSLLASAKQGIAPKHESIEDSFKDLINYASFAVSYLRGQMDGQDPNRDMFNEPKKPA